MLELTMIGRLILAAVLGGLVGFEREKHKHPAGLKTHTIVAIGACLMMLLSLYLGEKGSDPGRIAAQVVTGIGFLCAGTIMRSGMSVKGLTTAACLWTSAGVGLAVGAGYWQAGIIATILTLIVITVLNKIEQKLNRPKRRGKH